MVIRKEKKRRKKQTRKRKEGKERKENRIMIRNRMKKVEKGIGMMIRRYSRGRKGGTC